MTNPADDRCRATCRTSPESFRRSGSGDARDRRPAATMSPMSLLRALRRRQMLALGVAILLAAIRRPGGLVPGSTREVQGPGPAASRRPAAQGPVPDVETERAVEDYKRYQNTQLTLVKSQLVLNTALQDKKVSKYRMIREQARSDRVAPGEPESRVRRRLGGDGDLLDRRRSRRAGGHRQRGQESLHGRSRQCGHQTSSGPTRQLKKIKENYTEMLKERRDTEEDSPRPSDRMTARRWRSSSNMRWNTGGAPEGSPRRPVAETKAGSPAQDEAAARRDNRRDAGPIDHARLTSTDGSIRIRSWPA